jgi:hypothetical protein
MGTVDAGVLGTETASNGCFVPDHSYAHLTLTKCMLVEAYDLGAITIDEAEAIAFRLRTQHPIVWRWA